MFLIDDTTNKILGIAIIVIAIITFMVLLIYFFVTRNEKNVATKIISQKQSARIIVIDMKNNVVRYFDKNDISNSKECTLHEFLELYVPEDSIRIEKWVDDLLSSKKNVSDYLEADIRNFNEKNNQYSFLQVQSIDKKRKLVHLEGCIMSHIDVKNYDGKKKNNRLTVTNIEQMFTIENLKDKNKGSFIFVTLRNTKLQDEDDDKVDSYLFSNIKNIVIPYLKSNCSIADYYQASFSIFYPGISTRGNLLRLMAVISKAIAKYLALQAYTENYTYAIAGCLLKNDLSSYKQLVRVTRSITPLAMNHENHTMIYDESVDASSDSLNSYEHEFNNLLDKKDFKVLFQPVLNIHTGSLLAYSSTISCNNSIFGDVQELKEYAFKIGKNKELFAMFNKKVLAKYRAENIKCKLIYPVSVLEKDFIAKSFAHISNINEKEFILAFNEEELSQWLQDEEDIIETFENLKDHDFNLALVITRKESLLTAEIMQLFDYFIIDGELTRACRKLGRSILIMHSILDSLKNYKKGIIAYDLDTTNSLYLLTKLGIDYASSNMIGHSDEMILPVDKKKIDKVLQVVNSNN